MVSGGNDSLLVIWKDVTEDKKAKDATEQMLRVRNEQLLMNHLQVGQFHSALILAIKLEKPHQVFKIAEGMIVR